MVMSSVYNRAPQEGSRAKDDDRAVSSLQAFLLYNCLSKLHRDFKHTQKTPRNHHDPLIVKKKAVNKKRSRSWGIVRPTITKLEEDSKNLQAVVSRQLIELMNNV